MPADLSMPPTLYPTNIYTLGCPIIVDVTYTTILLKRLQQMFQIKNYVWDGAKSFESSDFKNKVKKKAQVSLHIGISFSSYHFFP